MPTNKSADAISSRMKFVGEDRSVLSGSFTTATMTSVFPITVIMDTIEKQTHNIVASEEGVVSKLALVCLMNVSIETFQICECPSSAAILLFFR